MEPYTPAAHGLSEYTMSQANTDRVSPDIWANEFDLKDNLSIGWPNGYLFQWHLKE